MHRPSASENPVAPLSHHIFDSTHSSSGIAMVRVDRPRLAFEGSVFHGREKDEHRYDVELGALDSWAVRGWFRPWREWTVQASHGFLHEPEALEPGNQRRTIVSASWFRPRGSQYTAMFVAVGRNARPYSVVDSVLVEGTHDIGRWRAFGRFENTSVETEILLLPLIVLRRRLEHGALSASTAPPPRPSASFVNIAGVWTGTLESSNLPTRSVTVTFFQDGACVDAYWTSAGGEWTGGISGYADAASFAGQLSVELLNDVGQRCNGVGDTQGVTEQKSIRWTSVGVFSNVIKCNGLMPQSIVLTLHRD
jgi:hypothetical protein